jgi:hypothetical protein
MINGWGLVRLVDVSHPWLLRFHQRPKGVNAARRSPSDTGPVPVLPVSGRRLPGRCLRLSSGAVEPRARGFACPAPPLLLAIASLPNPAIGHICLGLLPRKSLGYQSLHVWEARSAQIRGKISCNLVKNVKLCTCVCPCSLFSFLLVVFRFCWGLR